MNVHVDVSCRSGIQTGDDVGIGDAIKFGIDARLRSVESGAQRIARGAPKGNLDLFHAQQFTRSDATDKRKVTMRANASPGKGFYSGERAQNRHG